MHSRIIQLCEKPRCRDNSVSDITLAEDHTISRYRDYVGDKYKKSERKDAYKEIREFFDGIATFDEKKEKLTFLCQTKIREELDRRLKEYVKDIQNKFNLGKLFHSDLQKAGTQAYDGAMFYIHYGLTRGDMLDECCSYAGQTLYVGDIYDSHF